MELARTSAAGGHAQAARAQMAKAREVFDAVRWLPEDRVPLLARVAAARHAAGDAATARAEVAEALALFETSREQIQDFWRGAALRPVAEEGTLNPNARTRCEDLVANCLSMARCDVKPDDELMARLRATRAGLEDPW